LPLGYDTMFGGVILCGIYYFAASMVFPAEPRSWPNLDDWFWLHRRQVLGCILIANLAWAPIVLLSPDFRLDLPETLNILLYFGAMIVAACAKNRWIVTGALAILIVSNLSLAVVEFISRLFG
jgi:hypothetical protein